MLLAPRNRALTFSGRQVIGNPEAKFCESHSTTFVLPLQPEEQIEATQNLSNGTAVRGLILGSEGATVIASGKQYEQ